MPTHNVQIALSAVITRLQENDPAILRVSGSDDIFADVLPYGMFDPSTHNSMEMCLRNWVSNQTALSLGHCEQLQAFDDQNRNREYTGNSPHTVSVGYLALARVDEHADTISRNPAASWKSWHAFFPWEDWRAGEPEILTENIIPALNHWARQEGAYATAEDISSSGTRIKRAFGLGKSSWNDELVVERYQLLYAAGLVAESIRDGNNPNRQTGAPLGIAMGHNGRLVLATAMARLRTRIKIRPVFRELMDDEFTLTQLQQSVEKIRGCLLHKQNFRRQIENNNLVEPTGATSQETGGRPAALYRFR